MLRIRHRSDWFVDVVVNVVLFLLILITLVPFMQVITISLSPSEVINTYGIHLFPTKITLEGYRKILDYGLVWVGFRNSILRVVLGTSLSLFLYLLGAYPLSKKTLPHRKLWTWLIFFTMYFSGGLIPSYLLIKNLHLLDNFLVLILPCAISVFSLLIVRNFLQMLPEEVEESAKIDGANDIQILFKIIIPMSKPIIATIGLWTAVSLWNDWFQALIYIQDEAKVVLQLVLRRILLEESFESFDYMSTNMRVNTETMKMAMLVVTVLPIMCVYPFLQKYFIKGTMVGSLKG